jgi:hypothetical protein
VPAPALDAQAEGRGHLLRARAEVVGGAAEDDALAAPFVDRVVGADDLRVLLAQPLEPERRADLLVGRGDQDEITSGPEPLARERREGDRARRDLVLHVEGTAAPHLVADQLARPRVALPLRRVRDHRVRVAEEGEGRPVAAADARDEVRPLGLAGQQLRGHAVLGEVVAQALRSARLVPRRVDGVEADQPLQQPDRLVAQRDDGHQRRVPRTRR